MSPSAVFLPDRGVVSVEGADAADFLQGMLTNDVARLAPGEARFAALLTPQGKILFDFFAVRAPGEPAAFLLDCPAALAADLARRLAMYKLRARVAIADQSAALGVVADRSGAASASRGARLRRPARRLARPARDPSARRSRSVRGGGPGRYEAARIAAGVPRGGVDFAYGDAFPHDADMDLFNGVDFAKGCYVGQEVVSRMRHRGEARKRVVRVRLAGPAPAPGAPVMDGALTIGALGAAAGGEALALLRLDRVAEARAAGRPLTVGATELTLDDDAPASN